MVNAGDVVRASDVAVQGCRLTRTSAQVITTGVFTMVQFNAELFDTDGMHSTTTNNTQITFNTPGIYVVGFNGTFEAAATYSRVSTAIKLNGTTDLARFQNDGSVNNLQQFLNVSTVYRFVAGDYIEFEVRQVSGANKNLEVTADRSPQGWAARIGS